MAEEEDCLMPFMSFSFRVFCTNSASVVFITLMRTECTLEEIQRFSFIVKTSLLLDILGWSYSFDL